MNPTIALGVKAPEIENPMNQLAKVLQIKEAQQGQQMNQLKMDEYQRGIQEQEGLRADLAAPNADVYNALIRRGKVKEANDWQKGQADVKKTAADTDYKKIETAHKRVDLMGQTLGWVRQNPTVENATQAIQYLVDNGVMPPEKAQEALAKFQANPTPQGIAQFAEMGYRAALQAKEQLPKFQTNNIGGSTVTQGIDPVTGKASLVSQVQNTQSPDNKASVGASYANAAAVRATAQATRDAATTQANATREAAKYKDDKDREMKLGDDYRAQSKGFKEAADAYKIITATLDKAATSPAATLAAATKFMKQLDPGSVVRESELGMALAATGALDRAANYVNTLKLGKVLTPSQVKDFKEISAKVYQAAQEGQKQVDMNYRRQAEQYQLRPDMVVQDLGQNARPPVDLGSLPAGGSPKVVDFGSLK